MRGGEPAASQGPDQHKDRAPKGTLSRSQIVDAALRLGRGRSFEHMTIRSLATELGVAPMSLYRHIRDKDDLLNEVVEELLRRTWRAPATTVDWRSSIAKAADSLRRLLVREPAVLYVYQRRPVVSPTAIRRMNAMLAVFRQAGFAEEAAQRSYAAVHTFTVGFAALEASRASGPRPSDTSEELTAQLAAYTEPKQFGSALEYLLEGIDRLGRGSSGT